MIYSKKDEETLVVVSPVEMREVVEEFTIDILLQREAALLLKRDEWMKIWGNELSEVRKLLDECENLGIKAAIEDVGEVK